MTMLNIYFLNESFAWSIVGCLGSLPVTAQQNPPDFGHPIRNMSKGLPESKKTSEFTLSTRVAVEYSSARKINVKNDLVLSYSSASDLNLNFGRETERSLGLAAV